MRIATFNINNVNKRLANLLAWLAETTLDVVCLQELKAEDRAFRYRAIEAAGYGAVWRGQRTWNGVALLARGATPDMTRRSLPGDPADDQARYIEAAAIAFSEAQPISTQTRRRDQAARRARGVQSAS